MRRSHLTLALPALLAIALAACADEPADPAPMETDQTPDPNNTSPANNTPEPGPLQPLDVAVPRLTALQYTNTIHDLFGDDIIVPTALEPDPPLAGFVALGAGASTVSPRGVELYEEAAYDIAEQVTDPARRARALTCQPTSPEDVACLTEIIETLGFRIWRRPLDEEEVTRLTTLAADIGRDAQDVFVGVRYALAALLQSPSFIFREEIGEPVGDGSVRFSDFELASRLSFLLWNTTPDDELLDAAADGLLSTDEGLRTQAQRLLDDPRSREGVRAFFTDIYDLDRLDELNKDPTVFPSYSTDLGPWAREQTLLTLDEIVFEDDGDLRDLLTTRRTFLNRKLASLYGVVAPTRDGFAPAELPPDSPRVGFLGHAAFLGLNSHAVSTSATLRGKFIRERILCHAIPSPPADVDTSIPEPTGERPTLRDRVASHLEDPTCAGCHTLMDPIGLTLENFDGLGVWRETDQGFAIDTSGALDGDRFRGPAELAQTLHDHPDVSRCFVTHLLRYATNSPVNASHRGTIDRLDLSFAQGGHSMKHLLIELILSPAFRTASIPADDPQPEEQP